MTDTADRAAEKIVDQTGLEKLYSLSLLQNSQPREIAIRVVAAIIRAEIAEREAKVANLVKAAEKMHGYIHDVCPVQPALSGEWRRAIDEAKERSEGENMTPQEINYLLAEKVMGWHLNINETRWLEHGRDGFYWPRETWNPAENIEQAMMCKTEIVKKMRLVFNLDCRHDRQTSAKFYRHDGAYLGECLVDAYDKSDAAAICFAIVAVIEKAKQ